MRAAPASPGRLSSFREEEGALGAGDLCGAEQRPGLYAWRRFLAAGTLGAPEVCPVAPAPP